jgi:DNA-binding NtrC family response regulator
MAAHENSPIAEQEPITLIIRPGNVMPMREVERQYILAVLRSTYGNKSYASRLLGMDRRTLYRKLDNYRLTMDTDELADYLNGQGGFGII